MSFKDRFDHVIRAWNAYQIFAALGIGGLVSGMIWTFFEKFQRTPLTWQLMSVGGLVIVCFAAVWFLTPALVHWRAALAGQSLAVAQTSSTAQGMAAAAAPALNPSAAAIDLEQVISDSYKSDLMPETEANFRRAAERYKQGDARDTILVKFMALELVVSIHENVWTQIYASQLLLLETLNQKPLSLDEAKVFYDRAATTYPKDYQNESFQRWLTWLIANVLLRQDGMTIKITLRGKDFLKYLIHTGRSASMRTF